MKEFGSEVTYIGDKRLGLKSEDIGTHSVQSVESMAMFLENVPIFLIVLYDRWYYGALLKYTRKKSWSLG